ncbi:alpha/beta hydrolase [Micromonospora sp. M12]
MTLAGRKEGPTVVLAHGFGCDQHMWRHVVREIGQWAQVVLFDHVGSGKADPAAWDADRYACLDGYADDVLNICQDLNLRQPIFVGHSVSSSIGVLAANREPDRFPRLSWSPLAVLHRRRRLPGRLHSRGHRRPAGVTRQQLPRLVVEHGTLIMGNPERPELGEELTASFCRTDPAMAQVFARATFLSDNRADLAAVSVPTLILQCAQDAIAPPRSARSCTHRSPAVSSSH